MRFHTVSVSALAAHLGDAGMEVTVEGDGGLQVSGVASLENAGPEELSFLANTRYAKQLGETRAGAVIVAPEVEAPPQVAALLRTANPYAAFARALQHLAAPALPEPGVSPQAHVDPTATLGEGVTVMPGAYVGPRTVVGARTRLHPGVVVGADVRIGADCLLHPHVVVREECVLGDRVILQPGVIIGGDGYGFATEGARHIKIPQIGNVVLGDDVEIGAGTTVDRGALAPTVIGRGTKVDNLVMIAHGCWIGEDCLVVGQSGLSGSVVVEDRVTLAARVGITGHLHIGADSLVFSRATVDKNLPPGSVVSGQPARPHREELRQSAQLRRIDKLVERVAALEAELAALRDGGGDA